MSFGSKVERAWRDNVLLSVLVELTYRCNLDCFFCYNDLGLTGERLERDDYLRLLADLAEMQVLNLILSGGEPLAHPDFLVLGARARELGFVVRIKSNGHALRGELARRIRAEVDPFLIEVSLHGARAATHDRQTRVPGSFERLLANLGEMQRLGLRVKLNSTLTAWNEDEVEAMFALADRLGLPLQVDPEVTPRDDGNLEPLAITCTTGGLERLFRLQAMRAAAARARSEKTVSAALLPPRSSKANEAAGTSAGTSPREVAGTSPHETAGTSGVGSPEVLRQGDDGVSAPAGGKHCGAGSSTAAVDPFGNVYPCVQWRRPVGNLHRESMPDIWRRSTGLDEVRRLTVAAKGVVDASGADAHFMAFCPGAAAADGGDPLRLYPGALRRRQVLQGVQREMEPLLPVLR